MRIVAAIAGMALIGDSEDRFSFDQSWVSLAFSIVIVIVLVEVFMVIPAQKRLAAAVQSGKPDDQTTVSAVRSARTVLGISTGLIHLAMVALIALMVWKPGL